MTDSSTRPAKFAYGLDEVSELVGLGRSTLYLEVRAGRLKLAKVGKRSIVLAEDLAEFLAGLRAGKSAGRSIAVPNRDARKRDQLSAPSTSAALAR